MKVRPRIKKIPQGLLEGARTAWMNRVSEFENKCSRPRYPNVQKCSLYSEILDKKLTFHVTTSVLRTIDKYGGLDSYLINSKESKLDSEIATKWKAIIQYAAQKKQTLQGQNQGNQSVPTLASNSAILFTE